MKIKLIDIPEEGGTSVSATEAKDPWFVDLLLQAFGEDYPRGQAAAMEAHLFKTCNNIQLSGGVEVDLKPTCDRCLELFDRHLSVPVELNLSPRAEVAAGEEEVELTEDDLNFALYEGDTIDLGEVIRELLMLEIPIRDLCNPDCKGLCPKCGQNLNHDDCSCRSSPSSPKASFKSRS